MTIYSYSLVSNGTIPIIKVGFRITQYIVLKLSTCTPQPHFWIGKAVVTYNPSKAMTQRRKLKCWCELYLQSWNPTAQAFAGTPINEQF